MPKFEPPQQTWQRKLSIKDRTREELQQALHGYQSQQVNMLLDLQIVAWRLQTIISRCAICFHSRWVYGSARVLHLVEEDDPEEHQDIHQNGSGVPVLLRPAVALHIQDLQAREVRQGDSSLQRLNLSRLRH